jgi:hypothetical protein
MEDIGRDMKKVNKVLLSAALAGLLAGAAASDAFAEHHEAVEPSNSDVKDGCAGKDSCTGKDVEGTPVATPEAHKESCKAKSSCKGTGHGGAPEEGDAHAHEHGDH